MRVGSAAAARAAASLSAAAQSGCVAHRMDTDGNGTIEWDEFVDFMANPPPDAFKRPKNLKAVVAASQVRLVVPH